MAGGGRLLVVGFASGSIGSIKANLPLVKGYSVVGVRSGAELFLHPEQMLECHSALVQSTVVPQCEVFPASEAKIAFRKLAEKRAIGKLVLDFESKSKL